MRIKILLTSFALSVSSAGLSCDNDDSDHHGRGGHHSEHHSEHHSSKKHADEHAVSIQADSESLTGEVSMKVAGMMCSSCREKLEAAVKKLPEVASVKADTKTKIMTVTLKSPLAKSVLTQTVKDAGFNPM